MLNWVNVAAAITVFSATPMAAGAMPEKAVTILDAKGTYWRWFTTWRPLVIAADDEGTEARTTLKGKTISAQEAATVDLPVPSGWTEADFDDHDWPRTAGRWLEHLAFVSNTIDMSTGHVVRHFKTSVICLRGKFIVSDPAEVEGMYLQVTYRGGVAVYLNGSEIARANLPEGPLTAATPARTYPTEAYLDAAGKPLPLARRVKADQAELARRIGLRDRVLGPIALPVTRLRTGTNVLAIAIHRSDYHPAARRFIQRYTRNGWMPCALLGLRLAAVGTGAAPNCKRPSGLQVWNQDRNDRTSPSDYGDPAEPLRPMVLRGARNGVFSAKVVVSSDAVLGAVRAVAGDLERVGGKGTIPASAVRVQYAPPAPRRRSRRSPWNEPLTETPPDKVVPVLPGGGAVQSVWVAVRVAKETPPGDYRGSLTIEAAVPPAARPPVQGTDEDTGEQAARGTRINVPIELTVADWTIPDPQAFRTFVGVYQSPTAVSVHYKTPLWSERHWQVMDRSMELLGQLGNDMVNIPVVDRTKLGNDEGMVFWKKRPDGTFDYDFTVFDRYIRLVKKHLGVPRFVVLHVWHAGGWRAVGANQKNTVTVIDPATGKREPMQVPEFGTDESRAFWTPVLQGLKERLTKEGMGTSLCLGSLTEQYPPPEVCKMFAGILGEAQWLRITHAPHGRRNGDRSPLPGGGDVTFHIYTYLRALPDPAGPLPALWRGGWPRVAYYRRAQQTNLPLVAHRLLAAESLFRGLPGFSHACLDFWPCPQGRRRRGGLLYGRWPRASNYPGDPEPTWLTWPGPDGAEPLTAFEAVREGLQEAEAMIVLSEAVDEHAEAMGPELTARCRRVLAEALAFCHSRNQYKYQVLLYHMNHYGWQDLSGRIFALAAEATAKIGSGHRD